MIKEKVKPVLDAVTEKSESLRSIIVMTIDHQGQTNLTLIGPDNPISDCLIMEKVLSNWSADIMCGRQKVAKHATV